MLPRGHGNDGLLQDLKRLLDEARDLEDFNDEGLIRPGSAPNFFKATLPPSTISKRKSPSFQNLLQQKKQPRKRPPRVMQVTTTPSPTAARPKKPPRPTRYAKLQVLKLCKN